MQIPNFTMNELKDGLFLLEFFNQETLLFSIHVQFDIQSEFWSQENNTAIGCALEKLFCRAM